ncbi:protein SHORTAGE IN CHIASMATA 1 isoform X3 [Rhododendron vialii]|uniref:protein SHORTAGE IN CHIASMATA 1 isoform X3 n=1 Tax=Rhododendron vialii TaxID=182163 RepID=UPI00265EA163|nr:protein SHORTAGE IN CHIASMATA 1 isoform X3 [Rhododendron vialii]
MRTRFLSAEYSTSSALQALETRDFLRLPPPRLPPPSDPSTSEILRCFHDVSAPILSLYADTLPIDDALSKFFSDVVPRSIDVETGDVRFDQKRNFGLRSNAEDKNDFFCNRMEENGFEAVEFEMPELDLSLENACFFEEEKIELFAEVEEADMNLVKDILDPKLMLRQPFEILKSFYSVDDITPEYHMEQKDFLLEEAACDQDQVHLHNSTFPVLEVDEIGLGISSGIHMEEGFLLLENREVCPQREVKVDAQELLGSWDVDILDYLAGHSLSNQCFEAMPSYSTFPLEMDVISIIEIPLIEGNSAFQQGIPDDNSFCCVIQVNFEEIQFLESDSYQFLEVFSNSLTVCEAETCEQMFVEESNLGSFNELIVSHELTLVDESFKSLPIPILSDPEKIRLQFLFVEKMLAGLKPQHHSTSDGIYLDWHFLEDDYSNCEKYSLCWKQVVEINDYSVNSDVEPLNDGMLIFDLVSSGDTLYGARVEDNKETLNILLPHVPTVTESFNDIASGKFLNDGCEKHGDGEVLSGINLEGGSTLAESVLPFSDLNFLLNPRGATAGRSSKPAVKAFARNAVFPEVSRINQAAPCAATAVQLQQRDLKLHEIKLAGNELELVDNFHDEKCDIGSSRAGDEVRAFSMPLPVPRLTSAVEPERIPTNVSSTVIIVNTKNFDKEMIISRRSTYQKIRAMEKQGAQVVERDLKLPVDVIVSAAICLVWYDCRNIAKKASAPDESSSCLALCIENIAANVLTSLSFAFSSCILVFEGESSFLAAVMESSDELYAAAASLKIDLQLFCSYSSELTDEIILSCIGCVPKLTTHTCPKMPESETLAEYFLTTFPSINPLSAHAILSSVCILGEFLEWSHEHRIRAIQKYHVPDESVSLFSTLCKYGEREDSRSAMTDCSSSVSSAPDSEICREKTDSVRKKRKYIESPPKTDTPVDNLFDFQLLKQFPDGGMNPSRVSNPHDTWMSSVEEMFDEIEKPGAFVGGKVFSQKQGSGPSRGAGISNELKKPSWPLDDKIFGPQDAIDMALMNKLDFRLKNDSANLREDLIGEVIDIRDSSSLVEDISTFANSLDLSCLVSQTAKGRALGNVRTAKRLSFSRSSHPTFPTAAEISSNSNILVKDYGQGLREGYDRHTDEDFSKHESSLRDQEKLLEDHSIQRTATNFPPLSVQEEDIQRHGGTPLSKAVQSAQPHQGSPWTIEFLNRIRERSRSRQQSLPHGMSPLCFAYSGNVSKVTKRKSPSILDFYKYQGGSTTRKIIEQKRQKRPTQPSSSSKNEKTSASFGPSWTPLDKRARRILSFSMGGGGGQSKLVWSDKDAQTMDRRFYN